MPASLRPPLELALTKAVAAVPAEGTLPGGCPYEPKWDGYRAAIFIGPDGAVLFSRQGKDLTRYFPDLVHAAAFQIPPPQNRKCPGGPWPTSTPRRPCLAGSTCAESYRKASLVPGGSGEALREHRQALSGQGRRKKPSARFSWPWPDEGRQSPSPLWPGKQAYRANSPTAIPNCTPPWVGATFQLGRGRCAFHKVAQEVTGGLGHRICRTWARFAQGIRMMAFSLSATGEAS